MRTRPFDDSPHSAFVLWSTPVSTCHPCCVPCLEFLQHFTSDALWRIRDCCPDILEFDGLAVLFERNISSSLTNSNNLSARVSFCPFPELFKVGIKSSVALIET